MSVWGDGRGWSIYRSGGSNVRSETCRGRGSSGRILTVRRSIGVDIGSKKIGNKFPKTSKGELGPIKKRHLRQEIRQGGCIFNKNKDNHLGTDMMS